MASYKLCICHPPAAGHWFGGEDDELTCRCGATWQSHQRDPQPCSVPKGATLGLAKTHLRQWREMRERRLQEWIERGTLNP